MLLSIPLPHFSRLSSVFLAYQGLRGIRGAEEESVGQAGEAGAGRAALLSASYRGAGHDVNQGD